MNLLILSCGTRDKVVQFFRKAFAGEGKIVATDMNPYAPALYEADVQYVVPRMTAPGYIDVIFDICKKEKISGVISLIDPELSLIAKYKEDFEKLGVMVIESSFELCERTLNKWEMYKWMTSKGYPCAKSYIDLDSFKKAIEEKEVDFPVFVKPAKGSASLNISKAEDMETVEFLFKHGEFMMIQELMKGQEIGVDCYIDMLSNEVVSIFTKKKLLMRAGETDKAVSFKDDNLFAEVEKFVKDNGFTGQIDIDIFENDGVYYFSEVNPRFGGGYPHAYLCGADHMTLIKNNLKGIANPKNIGDYQTDKVMMKFNEIMMIDAVK